jgi:hypothetical protein
MDTTNFVYLEHLRDIAQQQRNIAAAMCAEARRMRDRAGCMLITLTATRRMLAEQRSQIAVRPSAA